jgi:type VI secretion system protein ImpH
MAGTSGRKNPDLTDELFRQPFNFDFFQAVRILERLALVVASEEPGSPSFPVGEDHPPEREAVRFRSHQSLSFPSSPIAQVRSLAPYEDAHGRPLPFAEMEVSFIGLTGPSGVLPHHYTALILRRIRDKDFSLRNFLDLFHHRMISFFYRAWGKYRLPFAYERSKFVPASKDFVTWVLYCLIGMGTGGLQGRLKVDDEALLYYSGHFAHFPRSAVSLESILTDYFALPVRVLQLQGQWLHLGLGEQSSIASPAHPQGLNNELGVSLVAGGRVWDLQSKFRLEVGPLTYPEFLRFLPRGELLLALCQMTRTYVGPDIDFDVQLVLKAEEVPATQLGPETTSLGWNCWLRTREFTSPARDAVFYLDQI